MRATFLSLALGALSAIGGLFGCGPDERMAGNRGTSALLYHSISDGSELAEADAAFAVDPERFRQQVRALSRAGYRTITVGELARFNGGDEAGIPPRPLVLTFDDGYRSSWVATDRLLRDLGYRATIFLEVGKIGVEPNYLGWDEVRKMYRSGRWNPQVHNGRLNEPVTYGDGVNDVGPPYAYRDRGETFAGWRERVETDFEWAVGRMQEELPGWEPEAWAVPFGNYGNRSTNDLRIQTEILEVASRFFPVIFGETCGSFIPEGAEPPYTRLMVTEPLATPRLLRLLETGWIPRDLLDPGACGAAETVVAPID